MYDTSIMQTTKRISWTERADRRKQIASAVTDTASIGKVAAKYGITIETVRAACRVYAPEKLLSYQPATRSRRHRRTIPQGV